MNATAILDDELEATRFTRALPGGAWAESALRIGGMTCASCASEVEAALRRVDGVAEARVSAAGACASVRWDVARTRPSLLVDAVERAGYRAVPDTAAGARALRREESRAALWRLFVAACCAMQVMMLATPSYVASAAQFAPDIERLLAIASWLLTLPVMFFSAGPFLSSAWRALRQRRVSMNVPAALGMAVAFVVSSGAAFDPGGVFGRELYFDSLTMFISFLLAGRMLEMWVRHRSEAVLEDTALALPQVALREEANGTVTSVSVQRLRPGDRVRVPVGQAFCADGLVLQGATQVDEALLSGESVPLAKGVGDAVIAGSMNLGGAVTVRVQRVGADTRFEAILSVMREVRGQRPALLRDADRWAAPFLWTVVLLAALAAAAWCAIDPLRAVWVAVSVLVVTCPCALSLAAPAALLSAATAFARHGLLLRHLDAIEALARVDTLFIDKTGTLTEPGGADVEVAILAPDGSGPDKPPIDEATVRSLAAGLAAWSVHPLSRALAAHRPAAAFTDIQEIPGRGLQGRAADGTRWQLGRAPAGSVRADVPGGGRGVGEGGGEGAAVWLCRAGRPVARLGLQETVRPQAAAAIAALRHDGMRVVLLSGDTPERVRPVAAQLGIADARGGMNPELKLAALREAQARGERVAMLGDGINDAPVLGQAEVSLAMGSGTDIARSQADGVLTSNDLGDVAAGRRRARRAMRVIRQNLAWAVSYNLACVPLALTGWLPPWAAGLGMATSSVVVVLNSMRLAR